MKSSPSQRKCWNGQQGNFGDLLSGLARQVGSDFSSLLNNVGALLTAGNGVNDPAVDAFVDAAAADLFGSNNSNAGILGSLFSGSMALLSSSSVRQGSDGVGGWLLCQ